MSISRQTCFFSPVSGSTTIPHIFMVLSTAGLLAIYEGLSCFNKYVVMIRGIGLWAGFEDCYNS